MKYHEYVLLSAMESCPRGRRSMIGNHVGGKHCLKGSESLTLRFIFTNWPVGQAVKTPPFHGGNTGSSPVRVIYFNSNIPFWRFSSAGRAPALQAGGQRFDPVNLHYSVGSVV